MAMFEFKDSKNIKIDGCETTSEKMVVGENVDSLSVRNSRAGCNGGNQKSGAVSTYSRACSFFGKFAWQLALGIAVSIISGVVLYQLGYGGS